MNLGAMTLNNDRAYLQDIAKINRDLRKIIEEQNNFQLPISSARVNPSSSQALPNLPNPTISTAPRNQGNNSIVTQSFLEFLEKDTKEYKLKATRGVHTNCILAVEGYLLSIMTPEQKALMEKNRVQLVSDSPILEKAIAGAPGTLYDIGIVGELVKFRGKDQNLKTEEDKLKFIQDFASKIPQLEGSLLKTDRVYPKPGGHEAVATNFKVVKDAQGKIIDVTWQDVSTRAPGSEGYSKEFSLREDFIKTGNRFTFGILKPEIIAQIEKRYNKNGLSTIA
jgi:hypothetical protein